MAQETVLNIVNNCLTCPFFRLVLLSLTPPISKKSLRCSFDLKGYKFWMQCQRVNFTTQLSCGLIKRLPQYSSHPIHLRFLTAFKKSHELCHMRHMQSIDLSVCTYALCVCVCVLQPMFTTVCTDESFSYQRIYSRAINDCSHFAVFPLQGYYCCLNPDALEVTAGRYVSEEEGSPTCIAPVRRGEIYLSLSCCLGTDQGTLTRALWTLLILYNLK